MFRASGYVDLVIVYKQERGDNLLMLYACLDAYANASNMQFPLLPHQGPVHGLPHPSIDSQPTGKLSAQEISIVL